MKLRIILALLVPLALLIAAGVYYKRSRDAEVLYQHHWRQEQKHLLAVDGDDQEFWSLNDQKIRVVQGYNFGPASGLGSLLDRNGAREFHAKLATDHRKLKERYERIMHRPWTSGD